MEILPSGNRSGDSVIIKAMSDGGGAPFKSTRKNRNGICTIKSAPNSAEVIKISSNLFVISVVHFGDSLTVEIFELQ